VFSKLSSNLTNPGILSPNGSMQYSTPAGIGPALAEASAATAQPGTSDVTGNIGQPQISPTSGDVVNGPDQQTSKFIDPVASPQPRVQTPTWAQAQASDNPQELTTKGKALSLLLSGVEGAARGLAAGVPINGGHTSVGLGPSLLAGVETPFAMKEQSNQLLQQNLEQQKEKAQIAALPQQQALQRMQALATIRKDQLVTPRGGGVFDATTNSYVPGTEPSDKNESLDNAIAAASSKAIASGADPSKDPTVQQLMSIKASAAKLPDAEQPLGARVPQLNDALQSRYQVLNPGKPLPAYLSLAPNATSKDFDRVDRTLQQTETASGTKAQQDQTNAIRQQTQGVAQQSHDDARLDKSYQFNQGRLDKMRTPVDQLATRFSRLQDTLAQGSPQADALVAPELLSVMSGGAGSGLRMNEAEIARIVGGRSKWQDLQAAAQKWSTNPASANSITQDQRTQIHALVSAVGAKVAAKQQILSDSENQLQGATDVNSHRKILADTTNKLGAIDGGSGGANNSPSQQSGSKAAKWGVPIQ
jgi:hypothetical protein